MTPDEINTICQRLIAFRDLFPPTQRKEKELLADACGALDSFAKLTRAHDHALDLLYEVRGLIDGQIDVVDGDYGEPRPNRAMTLASEIDEMLP